MWRLLLPALLIVAACNRGEAPPPAPEEARAVAHSEGEAPPSAGDVPPLPAADDAPLPAAHEVPGFLSGEPEPPPPDLPVEVVLDDAVADGWSPDDELPAREPTLAELMRGVTVDDQAEAGDEESWAFIGGGREAEPIGDDAPAAVVIAEAAPPAGAPADVPAAPSDAAAAPGPELEPEDPCAPLRRLLDKRKHYVRRTAAERDTFGYVENEEDLAALRLLQGLHRCAQYPDDEDCRTRPIEVDISEVEIASHQIHRQPSDLNAEGKTPDEIPHDPEVLDLLHRLERCERDRLVQPLLQR